MEPCDFGVDKEDCHKTSYVRKTGVKKLSEFSEEDRNLFLWRAGKRNLASDCANLQICYHHEAKLGSIFEKKNTKCCNLFKVHKNCVKGGHKISLELARKLSEQDYDCIPGWQLCRNCYGKAQIDKSDDDMSDTELQRNDLNSTAMDFEISEVDSAVSKSKTRGDINESLEAIGVSPIKTHSMPKHRRISYANAKLDNAVGTFKQSFATAVGINESDLVLNEKYKADKSVKALEKKASDLDKITEEMREKLTVGTLTYRKKVQILTLIPESWTIKFASNYFGVSEYLVRQARELKNSSGILAIPEKKTGKALQKSTIEQVISFYEDDEHSRLMPGKKDYVSIQRNVHKQKRLLLCNLKELYALFKKQYPESMIGFSKFCGLRPKWCVTVGSNGTHSVCVCTIHQNAILMVEAAKTDKSYKDMIDMVVCSRQNRRCMVHRCDKCPGTEPLRSYLQTTLDEEMNDEISFQQWQSTDRTKLVKQSMGVNEYIDLLIEALDALTPHSYIAKCQAKYLKSRKEYLPEDSLIVLGDFAENYTFVVQDEVQSFHWSKQYCTLHPAVVYYKENGKLLQKSFCILSDDLEHDTSFVYEIQRELLKIVRDEMPFIHKVEYFSDGCAGQYKNFKNLLNLCNHKEDFGIDANWTFFATSHGKSPCDGIGGTVKRLTARASLQRPLSDQILTVSKMLLFCQQNICNIRFLFIPKERMAEVRRELQSRFASGHTVPGTRSYHFFEPQTANVIAYKRTAEDDVFTGTFNITGVSQNVLISMNTINRNDYVACRYDKKWWIGLVEEVSKEEQDFKVSFLHPPGPSQNFYWPERPDVCWVAITDVICQIDAPVTVTGRTYDITEADFKKILDGFLL